MTTIQIDQHGPTDPHTSLRAVLAPLFTWRGMDVFPVFGAEGDDDVDDNDDASGTDDNDTNDDAGQGTDDTGSDTVSRADYDKLLARLKAADRGKSDVEKRLKAIEDSKKDELTKATERAAELEKTTEAQAKEIADLRLQNAFLTADTGITWHDPGDALALAERKGYLAEVVDNEGQVDSAKLTAKLKELAKAKPHLVKTGKENDGSSGNGSTPGPTGSNVGGKGKKQDKGPDLSRYARHFN